jgi:tRNA threonylcarbamoyladenosine biosynthesis protein TsaE
MTIHSTTPEATEDVGRRLGAACRGGELIGLVGQLGTGKTCLARGVAAGLGIAPTRVRSPSFTLIAEHGGRLPLFHIDLYRLDTASPEELWLREYLFGCGVAVVEWFDRLCPPVADEQLCITLAFAGGDERILSFAASGAKHRALLGTLDT